MNTKELELSQKMALAWDIYSSMLRNDMDWVLLNWRGNNSEVLLSSIDYAKSSLLSLFEALQDIENTVKSDE